MCVVVVGIGLWVGNVLFILKEMVLEIEFVGFFDLNLIYLDMIGLDILWFDMVDEMLVNIVLDLFFVGLFNVFYLDYIKVGFVVGVWIFVEKFVVII